MHYPAPDDTDASLQDDVEIMVHSFTEALPVSPSKLEQMIKATEEDQDLQQLRSIIARGWPDSIVRSPSSRAAILDIQGGTT